MTTPLSAPERPTKLTIREISTVAVEVPMRFELGTSAAAMTTAPFLLVDLRTDEGAVGRSYLFCYRRAAAAAIDAMLRDLVGLLEGVSADPFEAAEMLARPLTLVGLTGIVRMAASALDIALWDAVARVADVSLAELLGARPGCAVAAYNSSGLGLMSPDAAAREAPLLLAGGFRALKLRLGHSTVEQDLAVLSAVRHSLPDDVEIMIDYNQGLPVDEALRRGRALAGVGISWLEEPIRHDDLAGNARIARQLDVPLQLGENFNAPSALSAALRCGACDLVMPDAARIGGVSGWLQAARVAAEHSVPISSHLLPEVSAHLLAVSPTAHWLEYVDWANPVLANPLAVREGMAIVPDRAGIGLEWDSAKVREYRVG